LTFLIGHVRILVIKAKGFDAEHSSNKVENGDFESGSIKE
jgi:hypothetical protein